MDNEKKWYLSKTIWLGVLAIITAIVETIQGGGDLTAALLAGFGAVSVAIRGVTSKKLTK